MSILEVTRLGHGFGARTLFQDVSFRLLRGEHVGLVGSNGTGKSTFIEVITGQTQPDEGTIQWSKHASVGYLDQHARLVPGMTVRDVLRTAFQGLYELEAEMGRIGEAMATADPDAMEKLLEEMGDIQDHLETSGFYMLDAKVEEVAKGLGVTAFGLDRDVSELSGGQRTKVLLAKLLLQQPNVLILDEPTNYLDEEHINWLTEYLQDYPYAFLLVSHDTFFMNDVVNLIYHLEGAQLTRYAGNYENFLRVYEQRRSQQESAYERQQQEIARVEDFIARNKARVATRGMANSRQKMLDKMERIEKPVEYPRPTFNFQHGKLSGKLVCKLDGVEIGYSYPLLPALSMTLERGQKIAITGMNGVGKSTLLKTILGLIQPLGGAVQHGDSLLKAYFAQEEKMDEERTPLEELWDAYPWLSNNEVRGRLSSCGLTAEHINNKMFNLSGGEQAKVRLAKLQVEESNWLVMDEPTNHLDVAAKEELAVALKRYKGTLLLVCHEPEFYRDWITDVWNVEAWAKQGAR
ncbi:MAG TPA: ABC-F family ATP-binding cassette domain-containing protein [Symbiobacteriaceae bacterium]|nr:ABC-F family ATP-binding cassette domain-containing protein [Symbiobacteriaceae bacterium]